MRIQVIFRERCGASFSDIRSTFFGGHLMLFFLVDEATKLEYLVPGVSHIYIYPGIRIVNGGYLS